MRLRCSRQARRARPPYLPPCVEGRLRSAERAAPTFRQCSIDPDLLRADARTPAVTKEANMSAPRRTLPERPSLEQQKKLAKELLTAFQASEPEAVGRIRAELPDKTKISLTDAQFVLA